MKPKIINGKTLTGNMLLNLTFEYIEALNDENAPNIYSSLERIVHAETRKACDEVLNDFYDQVYNLYLLSLIRELDWRRI